MSITKNIVYTHFFKHIIIYIRNILVRINSYTKRKSIFKGIDIFSGKMLCSFERQEHINDGGFKEYYKVIFNTNNIVNVSYKNLKNSTGCIIHQFKYALPVCQVYALYNSIAQKKPLYFVETGFINSIFGFIKNTDIPLKFRRSNAFFIDDMAFYFDAKIPSRIECYLNSDDSIISCETSERCRKLISFITSNKLTKYNFQSLELDSELQLELGSGSDNILLADQRHSDASILRGNANSESFQRMRDEACSKIPESKIFIKTHPDRFTAKRDCYFTDIKNSNYIKKITEPCNPYTILEKVNTVYVCTSQLGMEALLAGKKVITYGNPIYAGWGLTEDRIPCKRRQRKVTLEELFHAIYLHFTIYVNPYTGKQCELEEFLEALLSLREEYFEYIQDGKIF